MTQKQKIKRTITRTIYYKYPWCFDDDSPSGIGDHILNYSDSSDTLDVKSDKEAQLAALDPKYRAKESCYHGRRGFVTKISKTVVEESEDGWRRVRTTKIPIPRSSKCSCGKDYWPIKSEKACHKLVDT